MWPNLKLEHDAAHAFYLGVELAHAQLAWQLGKRYSQDEPLDWGCAIDRQPQDLTTWHAPGPTLPRPRNPAAGSEKAAARQPARESDDDL